MSRLKSYEKYYPVELNYTDKLPIGWKLLRGKFVFKEVNERSEDGKEQLLSVSEHKGVVPRDSINVNMFQAEDYKGYKLCIPGDVVINSLWAWHRGIGVAEHKGIVSTAYSVHRLRKPTEWNYKYLTYLLRTDAYTGEYFIRSKGVWISRLQLTGKSFQDIQIIIPPLETQNAIVNYLDRKTQQIQEFIQKKERLIELLEEKKSAIINKSVIQGVDKNIKFKETDLGLIPEHWEVRRLGSFGRFYKGGNISRDELTTSFRSEDDVSAILYGDIYTKYNIEVSTVVNKISKETATKSVRLSKSDLLFTGSGETKEDIGKCVLFNSDEETYASGDVIIFRQKQVDSLFLSYSHNSSLAKYQRCLSAKGEIIIHTYASLLRNVYMPFPSTIEEQKQIATYIKSECSKLDSAITKARLEIEKVKEYQESLITHVVTGQLKV